MLRCAVLGPRFVEALRASVRRTSKGMGLYISSKMGGGAPHQQQQQQGEQLQPWGSDFPQAAAAAAGGQQRPFPYVVPIVAKSGQMLFEETGRCSKVSSACAEGFCFWECCWAGCQH